ncbi:hypothetical protein RDWZM_000747 [Blomia tropicalis]|uniref:RRM domain-containing protein n=1 Tax=Blomia tropicalis TaxID=40697 RepID=A0A9Q0MAY3_BLOTA|nr:hypothetical protein RDWZM_000747 [Blomia tropicalis]
MSSGSFFTPSSFKRHQAASAAGAPPLILTSTRNNPRYNQTASSNLSNSSKWPIPFGISYRTLNESHRNSYSSRLSSSSSYNNLINRQHGSRSTRTASHHSSYQNPSKMEQSSNNSTATSTNTSSNANIISSTSSSTCSTVKHLVDNSEKSPSSLSSPNSTVAIDKLKPEANNDQTTISVSSLASNLDSSNNVTDNVNNNSNNCTIDSCSMSNCTDTTNHHHSVGNSNDLNQTNSTNSDFLMSLNAPKFGRPVPNRVFVGGIPADVTEHDVRQLFAQYGSINSVKIINDKAGVSRGYGFVTFDSEDDAQKVIKEADNLIIKHRKLNVSPAVMKHPTNAFADSRVFPNGSFIYPQLPLSSAAANYSQFFPENFHGVCAAEGMPLYQIAGMNGHFMSSCPSFITSPTTPQYLTQSASNAYGSPYPNTTGYLYSNVPPTPTPVNIQLPSQHSMYHTPSHQHASQHLMSGTSMPNTHPFQYSTAHCAAPTQTNGTLPNGPAPMHAMRYTMPPNHTLTLSSQPSQMNQMSDMSNLNGAGNMTQGSGSQMGSALLQHHPHSHQTALYNYPTSLVPGTHAMANNNGNGMTCVPANMHLKADGSGNIELMDNVQPALLNGHVMSNNGSNNPVSNVTTIPSTMHIGGNGYMPQMMEMAIWPGTHLATNSGTYCGPSVQPNGVNYGGHSNGPNTGAHHSNHINGNRNGPLAHSTPATVISNNPYQKTTGQHNSVNMSNGHSPNPSSSSSTISATMSGFLSSNSSNGLGGNQANHNHNHSSISSSSSSSMKGGGDKGSNGRNGSSSYSSSHKKMYNNMNGNNQHYSNNNCSNTSKSKLINCNIPVNGNSRYHQTKPAVTNDIIEQVPEKVQHHSTRSGKQQPPSSMINGRSNVTNGSSNMSSSSSSSSSSVTNSSQSFITKTVNGVQIYALANNGSESIDSSANNNIPNSPLVVHSPPTVI